MSSRLGQTIIVLHSSSDLYGASKIVQHTIKALSEANYRVILCLSEEGPLADEVRKVGVDVRIIRLGVLRRRYLSPAGLLNRIFVIGIAVAQLVSLCRQERPSLVYSNTTGVLVGALVARLMRVPHLWHVHEIILSPRLMRVVLGWAIKTLSDRTIVVSDAVKAHWNSINPSQPEKLLVVRNGIAVEDFAVRGAEALRAELGLKGHIAIGMVGRVHYWKGQDYFIRIAAELVRRYPDTRFVMVGDAFPGYEYLYEQLKTLAVDLGVSENIIDLRYRSDIPRILAVLDIFVLPSILPDPLPTVVLEAMAASKPVVATAHGGAVEMVVDGVTGFHIPWDNPKSVVEILEPLMNDPALRIAMGREGKRHVAEDFSPSTFEVSILEAVATTVARTRLYE